MTSPFALPPVPLGYTDNTLDRASMKREDADWVAARAADPAARFYVFAGETPILKRVSEGGEPLFKADETSSLGATLEECFLGLEVDGTPRFVRLLPDLAKPDPEAYRIAEVTGVDPNLLVTDMRTVALQGLVAPHHLGPMAQGKALTYWHSRHRYCSTCGTKSVMTNGGWRRDCPSCKTQHFPRTDPVVIMLAIDGDRCLMGRQRRFPPGMYSALAGFLEPGETIAAAVRREIEEESGLKSGRVVYLYDQPWPFPESLMIGCHVEATSTDIVIDEHELEDARWFTREECWLILTKQHPDRISCPPPLAIAHHLIRAFVEHGFGGKI
ncbi:MAG: NAD(+) diphosphatase [Alphaproteobacteria bacterium]